MSRVRRCAGFSLVEALVTLLVLAIGLLGLGQLQARLWRGSGDLSALQGAFLLAQDTLEAGYAPWLDEPRAPPLLHAGGNPYAVVITKNSRPTPPAGLSRTRLDLRWQQASGQQSLTLAATRNDAIRPVDARWLLITP